MLFRGVPLRQNMLVPGLIEEFLNGKKILLWGNCENIQDSDDLEPRIETV